VDRIQREGAIVVRINYALMIEIRSLGMGFEMAVHQHVFMAVLFRFMRVLGRSKRKPRN
jgi:hypothetical protein